MKNQTDEQILHLLKHSPQQGMELLVESYTGLIWKVISFHLKNPEDIKECVNDTFASFYFNRNTFDASKASLSIYLTAIARNTAISRYRKEKKHAQNSSVSEVHDKDSSLLLTEIQADLSRALETLKPNELQIIRMKYYGGMTIAEIAESLNLPYETVKKRHQRSLSKLRHNLFLLLLVLLLMLFSVCTYAILRHFDIIPPLFSTEETDRPDEEEPSDTSSSILPDTRDNTSEEQDDLQTESISVQQEERNDINTVNMDNPNISSEIQPESSSEDLSKNVPKNYTYIPGYGIKEVSSGSSYTLSSISCAEDNATQISVTSASLIGKKLKVTITALSKTKPFSADPAELEANQGQDLLRFVDGTTHALYYHGEKLLCSGGNLNYTENRYMQSTYFETENFEVLESDKEQIPFTVHCYDLDLSFSLTPAVEENITENNVYQMKEYGGLMIVPRLENGSLKIAIHPLNRGEFVTLPGLIRGPHGEKDEDGVITATDEDGNTLIGNCIRYYPGSTSTYFEWNFGEASPGSYSLHIPFLLQLPASGDSITIPINFTDKTWEDKTYEVPGGKIWVSDITDPYQLPKDNYRYERYENMIKSWGTPDYPSSYVDNPDNYIYQNLTLSGKANDSQHQFEGIFGTLESDFYPGAQEYDYIDSEELSKDYSSQTFTYLSCFLKECKDPATAKFTLSSRSSFGYTNTPVYYRWTESFDFTFTVE